MKLAQINIDSIVAPSAYKFDVTPPSELTKALIQPNYSRMLAEGVSGVASDANPIAVRMSLTKVPERITVAPTAPMRAAVISEGGQKINYNITPGHHIPEDLHQRLNAALEQLTQYESSANVLTSIDRSKDPRQLMLTTANVKQLSKDPDRERAVVPVVKDKHDSDLGLVLDISVVRDPSDTRLLTQLHDVLVDAQFVLEGLPTGPVLNTGREMVPLLEYELSIRKKRDAFRRELGLEGSEEWTFVNRHVDTMQQTGRWNDEKDKLLKLVSPEVRKSLR